MRTRVVFVVLCAACAGGLTLAAQPGQAASLPSYRAVPIESPNPQARTRFGDIVHTIGDINGDGVRDVITTADSATVNGVAGVGQVYVLSGRTGAVLLTLNDPEPQANAGFGVSITGLGDVNGDGVPDIAVGAPFQTVNGNANQGKMYVFSGRDGHLLHSIDDPRPQANAYFGALFVTGTGDLNGDGVPDLAVASPGEDVGAVPKAGAAYVFEGRDGTMVRRIPNPNPETFVATNEAFFSMGLTNPGDVNGDGVDDLVVGFAGTTVNGNVDQGRAYVYNGKCVASPSCPLTGALLRTLDDPVPQAYAYFGSMYSDPGVPGDVNGDGVRDIFVDADGQTVSGVPNAGAAYLFSGQDGSLLRTLTSPVPEDSGFFGFISSPAGDLNRDGTPDLLVGQTGAAHIGGAYAYGGAWVFDPRSGNILADFTSLAPDAGQGIASPGDANGDGFPDYFLSAPRTDVGANPRQGRVFQVLSVPPPPLVQPPPPGPQLPSTPPPAIPPRAVVSNDFGLRGVRVGSDGTITLSALSPGGGRFSAAATTTVAGSTIKRKKSKQTKITYGATTITVARVGLVNVVIKPTARAKRALKEHKQLLVLVSVTFQPTGGSARTRTKRVRLKARKARKKHTTKKH